MQTAARYVGCRARLALAMSLLVGSCLTACPVVAQQNLAEPISQGQRVFSAGHSFHVFMPGILQEIVKSAKIDDHVQVGLSSIGGSRVIQHWDVPEDKNPAKAALRTGKVDVLTLAPIHLPDEGIENFTKLALEHNPDIRVTVQEFWLPFDLYDTTFTKRPVQVDHNALSGDELRKLHAPYFESMDAHVRELNQKFGKTVLYVVPVGQAVIALREQIVAGKAPGLKTQEDLFTDPIGHARPALQTLVAYCHFAVTYRRSPVGLPVPTILGKPDNSETEQLNRLLQELAWQAVVEHPLAGVKVPDAAVSLLLSDGAFPAHRVIGNVYYVGSKNMATYLITTEEGHILINSGFEETVPLIRVAVESLGFKMRDVKVILASHAHSDHVAGHALLKELTGAQVYVMQGDDGVISTGGEGQYLYTDSRWKPCAVERVLKDGDEVKLGSETLIARRTPGHTRGCTTWTWKVTDGDKKLNVVVIGSPNVNPGYKLVGNADYPEIADDYAQTFAILKGLPCDVFLGAHGEYYGLPAKYEQVERGAKQNPFVDPEGYQKYVTQKEAVYLDKLAMQKNAAAPQP